MTAPPETRYARNGTIHLAYQVLGSGPVNLVGVSSGPEGEVAVACWEAAAEGVAPAAVAVEEGAGAAPRTMGAPPWLTVPGLGSVVPATWPLVPGAAAAIPVPWLPVPCAPWVPGWAEADGLWGFTTGGAVATLVGTSLPNMALSCDGTSGTMSRKLLCRSLR